MSTNLRLAELTREEVRELAPRATIIVPTASTEQHGPHLPLMTDSVIGEAIAIRAAERAAQLVPVLVAPVLPFGVSAHHLFACALSLSSTTFLGIINDLGDSLASAGFKRIFFLNSHGGNEDCLRVVAKDLVTRRDVAIAACSYWQVADKAARETGVAQLGFLPGHAGGFETSLMMTLTRDNVRMDRFPDVDPNPPAISNRGVFPGLAVQKADEWKRVGGYSDAPTKASSQWGDTLLEAITVAVADSIVAFHHAAF